MRVEILKDIQVKGYDFIFTKSRSRIEYDSYHERGRKMHSLIYQQGARYGSTGDCCAYLSHDELTRLQDEGAIRLVRERRLKYS